MWSYIKKAINSNLAVPLNDLIGKDTDSYTLGTLFGRLNSLNQKITPAPTINSTVTQSVSNTWYTAANITAAKGITSKLIVSCVSTGGVTSTQAMRVTIDGGSPIIVIPVQNNQSMAYSAGTGRDALTYELPFKFESSLFVEVMNTASNITVTTSVSYGVRS